MKKYIIAAVSLAVIVFIIGSFDRTITGRGEALPSDPIIAIADEKSLTKSLTTPEAPQTPTSSYDAPRQKQLSNPPVIVKAIYLTSWSAGSARKMDEVMDMLRTTELNAVVIDVKDYTGVLSYHIADNPKLAEYATTEARIARPNALIKRLHDEGIYVIGRVSVFQDDVFSRKRPDLALRSITTGNIWHDRKDIAWLDASSRETWDYHVLIARDMIDRGFDEVNFDYIRFPSDGNVRDIAYPLWDGVTPEAQVISNFSRYIREQLPYAVISADILGLTTVAFDDLGIGQYLEDIVPYFDAVAPMVYPSHYATGFQGYANPAAHPYEVIQYSMDSAFTRLQKLRARVLEAQTSTSTDPTIIALQNIKPDYVLKTRFRPWIQDFNLGTTYTPDMVRAQIQATEDALGSEFAGWMIWSPSNRYQVSALLPE